MTRSSGPPERANGVPAGHARAGTSPGVAAEPPDRAQVLAELAAAGREHSNVAVMFHSALAARLGLSATENKTLDLLERHGSLSPGDLVRHTGLAPASITGLLDRLQERGYVRRLRDAQDGRRQLVEIDRSRVAGVAELFAGLTAGLDALYADYSTQELALITDWLTRATEVQSQATRELTDRTSRGANEAPPGRSG